MKKLYTLAFVALSAIAVNAQTNLVVVNPGLETWTNGQPEGYTPYTGTGGSTTSTNNFLTQETTIKHGGASSAKHQSQDATQNFQQDDLIEVIPGHSYTISYWYLDNDDNAATRMWSSWLNASNAPLATQTGLQVSAFSSNSPQWVNQTVTLTAPEGAASLRFQVRTYRQSTTNVGGYIYYDDFSVIDNTPAGVANNQIEGFKMFPNPNAGNILNITSNANGTKAVAIFDVLGKQVLNTSTTNSTVNVSNLTSGVYIVKVTEEGKTATKKLIKQ